MIKASHYSNRISIIIHILGWSLVTSVLFLLTPLSWKVDLPIQFWVKQAVYVGVLIGVFYFNLYYMVPRFLFKGKTKLFVLILLLSGLVFHLLLQAYDQSMNMSELMHNAFRPGEPYVPKRRNISGQIFNIVIYYLSLGISTTIGAVQKWQADEAFRTELEQQKTNSELIYLKAQINPHFFFNTLNNIYSLTNIDIEKAQTALLKLSRMMRYVLYETEKDQTLLSKELDFIKDYITLMRLRLPEKVKLDIEMPQQFNDVELAPMLLLPYIENCFKHGISSQQQSQIVIKIGMNEGVLSLNTVNSIYLAGKDSPEGDASGIGLVNTERRLSLLYGKAYELKIDANNPENQYRVNLKIRLK